MNRPFERGMRNAEYKIGPSTPLSHPLPPRALRDESPNTVQRSPCADQVLRLLVTSLVWLGAWNVTRADDIASAFEQANKLYEQGHFVESGAAYEKLIANGQVSPALYFNFGNALFKSGQIGRAI